MLGVYCCIANYPNIWQLKTLNIPTVPVGQEPGISAFWSGLMNKSFKKIQGLNNEIHKVKKKWEAGGTVERV